MTKAVDDRRRWLAGIGLDQLSVLHNRPAGDHGTALQALNYALDVLVNTVDVSNFLERWREGDLDEWPEFYGWLARQEQAA